MSIFVRHLHNLHRHKFAIIGSVNTDINDDCTIFDHIFFNEINNTDTH